MNKRCVYLLFLLTFLPASNGWAQTSAPKTGTAIKGTVVGVDGKPVAGAVVTCQSSAGIHPHVVHADDQGHYVISGLKQDSYDVRATSNGAASDWEKNIPVRKGQTKNITLHLLNRNSAPSAKMTGPANN